MNVLQLLLVAYFLVALGVNSICGFIAYAMAGRRGMRQLPAFFGGLFGSVFVLFYIAMYPVVVKKEKFPVEDYE